MITQETTSFPNYLSDVQEQVDYHREMDDEETLLLAVYYAPQSPERPPNDVYLFEVYEGFHQNRHNPDGDFYEVGYGSTEGFPLERGQYFHIVLTNPVEFKTGVLADWPKAHEVHEAVKQGDYKVLYQAPSHEWLLEMLRG